MPAAASQLSFPPLLDNSKWKNATSDQHFPGGSVTWRKALAPRPLHHEPSPATVTELRMATGGRFGLLQETTALANAGKSDGAPGSGVASPTLRVEKPVLYNSLFPGSSMPNFSVWDYCKKHGHAPPRVPQPPIRDLKGWFQEYGRPRVDCPPGFRSEFAARTNVVRKPGATDITKTVRMIPGRVLK